MKEKWRVEAGRLGGKKKGRKGFAVTGDASDKGKSGGSKSRRGFKYIESDSEYNYYTLLSTGERVRFERTD